MEYLSVIEQGPSSFGAHVPDLSDWVAMAVSRAKVAQLIEEAIRFPIAVVKKEDSLPIAKLHLPAEMVQAPL